MAEATETAESANSISERSREVLGAANHDERVLKYSYSYVPISFGSADVPVSGPVSDMPRPDKQPFARSAGVLDEEYEELVKKLGIASTAILEARLEQVIAEEIPWTFEYDKVKAYLDNECRKAQLALGGLLAPYRVFWEWKPVRKCDRMKSGPERISHGIYKLAIPHTVLCTVKKIADRLPEACFFVSEIREVADPFLGVTVPGSERMLVLEVWDEPGFRS